MKKIFSTPNNIFADEQKMRDMVHSVFVQESKSFHPIMQSVIRNNFDDFARDTTVSDSAGSVYSFLLDIGRENIREVARELLHNYSNMLLTRSCCNDFSELDSKLVSGF